MANPIIKTVTGAIDPGELGLTLHHEHVMSTFGADPARYPYYDPEQLPAIVLPYLKYLRSLGVQSLVDCTAAYFGRHPELLRRFALDSDMHILTNTGYYGAAGAGKEPPHCG